MSSPDPIDAGFAALREGRYEEALETARAVLARSPADPRGHHVAGLAAYAAGHLGAAIDALDAGARAPGASAALLSDLGAVLFAAGQAHRAATAFGAAIAAGAGAAAATGLGHALRAAGDVVAALAAYRRAIAADPNDHEPYLATGTVLLELGEVEAALGALRAARRMRATDPVIALATALAAVRFGSYDEAREAIRTAMAAPAQRSEALAMEGLVLLETEDPAGARETLERALAMRGDLQGARLNLARVHAALGDDAAAEATFAALIADQPQYAGARIARAIVRLQRGDYPAGFADYAAVLDPSVRVNAAPYRESVPLWDGTTPVRRLLIARDQGLGDFIQMLRFIPAVAARCERLLLEVPPACLPFARALGSAVEIRTVDGARPAFGPGEVDVYLPLMQIPRAIGLTLADLPYATNYIAPDARNAAVWRERIGPRDGTLRVGMIWGGNPRFEANRRRGIDAQMLAAALDVPGVTRYALQYGAPAPARTIDLGSGLRDFGDTAAAMTALDLIVSTDTGPVHVAGALGVPVLLLVGPEADWRWLRDREDSPWYPSVRVMRRARGEPWDALLARVRDAVSARRTDADSTL